MAHILEFPSGRRVDGLPFSPTEGWGGNGERPASVLIGFTPEPIDLARIAEILAIAGVETHRGQEHPWPTLEVDHTDDRRQAPLVLFEARSAQPWAPAIRLLGLSQPNARVIARAGGWLAVSTRFPSGLALEQFHFQLRIASLMSPAPIWYDASAERFIAGERVTLLAASPARPAASELMWIHQVESGIRRRSWLHTHGLQRAGIPDLELFGIAPRHVGIARRVLPNVAARLIESGPPRHGEALPISQEVTLQLAPSRLILPALRRGTPGAGSRERRREMGDEDATLRGALVPPPWPGPPFNGRLLDRLLLRAEQGGTLLRPAGESARLRALAAHSLPVLLELLQRREPGWVFAIELGMAGAGDHGEAIEHQWFEPLEADETSVLASPLALGPQPTLFASRTARHPWERLSDWYLHDGQRRFGPLEAAHLLARPEGHLGA